MAHIIKDRVKETSTSTGTGTFSLAGAMTGFRAFSAVCSVGDTVRYAIQAVDSNGAPSGDWEVGYGTYSAANTLTRTTVVDSSNAGSAVNFAAGTKQVWVGMDATMAGWVREKLTADRTYYVATTGSDSNTGLSAGSPFLTIQKAVDVVCDNLNVSGYTVIIQVADGTYTGAVSLSRPAGSGGITIQGNASTPANVYINVTGACFSSSVPGTKLTLKDMRVQGTTYDIYSSGGLIDFSNLKFWGGGVNVFCTSAGLVTATGNYELLAGASCHLQANGYGRINVSGRTITFTNSPAYSSAFVKVDGPGMVEASSVMQAYSGGVTGTRYLVSLGGLINTSGGGASYFPGNVAGTATSPGTYL